MRRAAKRPVLGFTLIEALVAMVMVATVGYAVFALINSHYNSFRRVQDTMRRTALERSVLDVAQQVNPMTDPRGKTALGDYRLEWQAERVREPREDVNNEGFQVAVYRTLFKLLREGDTVLTMDLLLAGYEKR